MGLYNMLFGEQPVAGTLLEMLQLKPDDVGRYRDCYVAAGPQIVVFTRNGGGNRADYEEVTSRLRAHPEYLTDYDDDFDSTYASYEFRVPDAYRDAVQALLAEEGPTIPPMEKFHAFIRALNRK